MKRRHWIIRIDKLLLKAEAFAAIALLLTFLIAACFLLMLGAGVIVRVISTMRFLVEATTRKPTEAV